MKKSKQKIVYSPTVYGLYSSVAKRFNFPDLLTPSAGGETWHVEGGKDKLVNDKNSFKAFGILSGVGLGFLQGINYIRNEGHDRTI